MTVFGLPLHIEVVVLLCGCLVRIVSPPPPTSIGKDNEFDHKKSYHVRQHEYTGCSNVVSHYY